MQTVIRCAAALYMWELPKEASSRLSSLLNLPNVTFQAILVLTLSLLALKVFLYKLVYSRLNVMLPVQEASGYLNEWPPMYHLAIVIIVLTDIDWNMFDLCVWAVFYIGVGDLRRILHFLKD